MLHSVAGLPQTSGLEAAPAVQSWQHALGHLSSPRCLTSHVRCACWGLEHGLTGWAWEAALKLWFELPCCHIPQQ